MVLCYVDDLICLSHKAVETLWEVMDGTFTIKQDKIDKPEIYLGAQLQKRSINSQTCWTMSSKKYVTAAVKNVEE